MFFGLIKPGIARARTAADYIQWAKCQVRSEIFSKDFSGFGHLKIPAATRKLSPMKIVCTYNGSTRKYTIESEKIFLANPFHRALIMRGSRMKNETKRAVLLKKTREKLQFRGYGNSIIVNF
ncbi:hypothetical protein [Planktotalea sp.]|uniref:hypothetical protein n=1 Tax=Planktotalea sp. TaxID=2029877 RepID=UPI0025D390C5|nr:hypothetical protein [Planktotalea sp.]